MQIVITMDEKTYKHIMEMQFYIPGIIGGKAVLWKSLYSIRTGAPLPKGHGRLVDADAFMKDYGNPDIEIILDNMDTIIEADKAESEGKE